MNIYIETYRIKSGFFLKVKEILRKNFSENSLILILVAIYVLAGYVIESIIRIPDMMQVRIGYKLIFLLAILFSICFLIIQILRKRTWYYFNYESIGGFLIILCLLTPFKTTFASIKQVIPYMHPFSWDAKLTQIDYIVHFGNYPWKFLKLLIAYEDLLRSLDILYILWFPVLFFFCFWMAWSSRRRLRLQFFLSTLIVWIIFGSILGTVFSSAGPCYYALVVNSAENPYVPLMEALSSLHQSKPLWAVHNQLGLWNAKVSNIWLPFGGISAMPSIHVAMAVIFALVAWTRNVIFGIIFVAYAAIIQIGSIILGWHYAVDGYVSIILTLALWKFVGKGIQKLGSYGLQP